MKHQVNFAVICQIRFLSLYLGDWQWIDLSKVKDMDVRWCETPVSELSRQPTPLVFED